jgi:hypothetical protein
LVAALAADVCVSLDPAWLNPARLDPARLDPCAALLPDAASLDDDVLLNDDSFVGAAVERTALETAALDNAVLARERLPRQPGIHRSDRRNAADLHGSP